MSVCDFDCIHCKYEDCINDSYDFDLSEEELAYSNDFDSEIKLDRRKEQIRQIDDSQKRAYAKYMMTPKGKEKSHRWNTSEKGKQASRKYERTEKRKEYRKKYEQTSKRKEYRKKFMSTYYKEKYKQVERDRAEQKRYNEAVSLLDTLLETGSVSVLDGQRNRPRERGRYDRMTNIILEKGLAVKISLDVEKGIVERIE